MIAATYLSPMLLRTADAGGFLRTNPAFHNAVGIDEKELITRPFLDWISPEDVGAARDTLAGALPSCRITHKTAEGGVIPLDMRVTEHDGKQVILAKWVEEEPFQEGPSDHDDEATVSGTLHTIARILEDQNPGFKCSILLVADGKFVRGAGPSLPEEYNDAIDGFAIGPTVGSCGTAIYWNVPVIVEDIQNDPLWADLAPLAKKAGVAACWSHPFVSSSGNVLGALAFYSPEPRTPSEEHLGRLRAAARMTGLAVERGRAEESLRRQYERELELEEQLRQAAKMEALGVLAGGIAHDFNNVLATILANAEFGMELLPQDSVVREMLEDITEASQRAGQFCQRMLDYAGRGSHASTTIEIGSLIPELNNLVLAALSKKINLDYALLQQPIYVQGDESQLLQVFMNLVTNAAEAIGENEGCIIISSTLVQLEEPELQALDPHAQLAPGQYLQLKVSDDGVGMDPETRDRIFDPFFTTKDTGHGLGLSAVKGIINRHDGAITIDSETGKGTTFTVTLPTAKKTAQQEEPVKNGPCQDKGKFVLVADDEPSLRSIMERKLEREGFQTVMACDGQEAVDLFHEHRDSLDCVLLDFSMPKLNGEEALRAIQAIRPDVPVVLMSGFSEQDVVNRFRDAGIAGCLQKPISPNALVEKIREAMGAQE